MAIVQHPGWRQFGSAWEGQVVSSYFNSFLPLPSSLETSFAIEYGTFRPSIII